MSFLRRSLVESSRLIRTNIRSRSQPPIRFVSLKFFSTETVEQTQSSPIDQFLNPPSGLLYGRVTNISKYTTKTDIIHFLDESDLSPDKLKVEYDVNYLPFSAMAEFSSQSAYDSAFKAISRKGRLFGLAKADRAQWDAISPYDGKAILLQGIPSNALIDDVERFLCGCQYDSTSIVMTTRAPSRGGAKTAVVRFPSQALAMHTCITKNKGFCLNNKISVRVLH